MNGRRSLNEITPGIQEFFAGRTVFITGGTGFLGAVLLEKLLRACPEITTVYLLVRPKRLHDVHNRVSTLFDSPLFSKHGPESRRKVVAIPGDVSKSGLALHEDDRNVLIDTVSVVFHAAATINFNAALQSAININLIGTKRVLQLCHHMKNIKALVYVSTAYCNCTLGSVILEQVYPAKYDPNYVIELVQNKSPEETRNLTARLTSDHPNTYSFSKQLAENLVKTERKQIPVAIVRPTVVLGTLKEPVAGWIDNVQTGGFAFIAGAAKGVFRVVVADQNRVADIVPCDHVANLMLAAAWRAGVSSEDLTLKVYHCSTGTTNPVTWGQYTNHVVEMVRKHPCHEMLWYPAAKCRLSPLRSTIAVLLLHILPAYALLAVTKLRGKPNRVLLSVQQKYALGIKHVKYFTKRQWHFDINNTSELAESLKPTDRRLFDFDPKNIDWYSYLQANVLGVREYYHKEPTTTLNEARKRIKRFWLLHMAAHIALFLMVLLAAHLLLGTDLVVSIMLAVVFTVLFVWL
ncbi:putative fatty acyl-CoA reductase CG5065 isoform X2 [Zootermopsis nevadensis]|nr:putative fatty acyl-CoA reductase CG5065 isoform X2 [Zootermopsis nevadensis]XP_021926223.1 putative fatty acyl-CoA reductase CG5065 isoform X2 [Zootermopsis nevadensis]